MISSNYIEDVFSKFYIFVETNKIALQRQDLSATESFYDCIASGQQLTQNQGNFIIKILQKYKNIVTAHGYDYSNDIENPQWKKSFRVLDTTKKIFVFESDDHGPSIGLKFPYQLKKAFEEELESMKNWSIWDHDEKLRKISIYDANVIQLFEFVKKHNFEIDESFMSLLSDVEEIWQNQAEIAPSSIIEDNKVKLVNASEDAMSYWQAHASGKIPTDLLLAKSMGFKLDKKSENTIERIAATTPTTYWIKTIEELLVLCDQIDGRICIVLDRVGKSTEWLKEFSQAIDNVGIDSSGVRVCFRAEKGDTSGLNDWIKEQGYGGKVDDGKFLIFNHKPAKWLFKEQETVKILVSNNLYPSTNHITKDWFSTHPCVIYVGKIKPSESRNQNIVEL